MPLTYFFEDGNEHPALAKALQKVRERPGPLQEVVVRLALMSDSAVNDALDIIKLVMRNDSGHEKAPCTAAEARAQYGHSK